MFKIKQKLLFNKNHYSDNVSQIVYIITRFDDKITNHILTKRRRNAKNLYKFYIKILNQLIEFYENFDRKINVKREYQAFI